jgi:tripartite-type tricarboxylate transporter receptor subunit TctC
VRAQPGKTLRLIVPFPPGGSTDILARAVGAKLGLALGQTVVIDNKAGAGGSLGATEAARAEADGNTLLMGHIGTLVVNPALYPKLPYDPLKRLSSLPDVPTIAESGYPGFDADQWYGIVAPAGTSAGVVARLNAEINKALQTPAVAQQLAAEGAIPTPGSPKAFGDLIAREIPRWAEVVKAGNVKPD